METHQPIVGRLAPSPTGALHLGNARSFLLAWLSARAAGGKCYLRIEDIDSPRVKPKSIVDTFETLKWLGLDWDAWTGDPTPTASSVEVPPGVLLQTDRMHRYGEVLQRLIEERVVYGCCCTRSQIQSAASAPHESLLGGVDFSLDGPVYPETCRQSNWEMQSNEDVSWRWKWSDADECINDGLLGKRQITPRKVLGDFVVAKKDQSPAYQLAVIVDDFDMQVNEVVRGDDLVASGFRQVALLDHLKWPRPNYYHVPLMVGVDGRRLAKRHGDTRVSYFREQGCSPEAVIGYLASTAGLNMGLESCAASDLIGRFEWPLVNRKPTVVDQPKVLEQLRRQSR